MSDGGRGFRGGQGDSAVSRSGFSGGVVTCFACGEKGHRSVECRKNSGAKPSVGGAGVRPVTCFSCGKPGHRSIECPSRKAGELVKRKGTFPRLLLEERSEMLHGDR